MGIIDNLERSNCTSTLMKNMGTKYAELYATLVIVRIMSLALRRQVYQSMFTSDIYSASGPTTNRIIGMVAKKVFPEEFMEEKAAIEAAKKITERRFVGEIEKQLIERFGMRYLMLRPLIFKPPVVGGIWDMGVGAVKMVAKAGKLGLRGVGSAAESLGLRQATEDSAEDAVDTAAAADAAETGSDTAEMEAKISAYFYKQEINDTAEGAIDGTIGDLSAEGEVFINPITAAAAGTGEGIGEGAAAMIAADAGADSGVNFVPGFGQIVFIILMAVQILFVAMTIDFVAPDLALHHFSDNAGCIGLYTQDNNKTGCANGYLDENGDCKWCKQIDGMRDYENPVQYDESYRNVKDIKFENQYISYAADAGDDPSVVHKLTSLICSAPGNDGKIGPTYADRPLPGGYCFRELNVTEDSDDSGTTGVRAYYDENNAFLSNDPSMCTEGTHYKFPSTADFDYVDVSQDSEYTLISNIERAEANDTFKWNWMPLEWAKEKMDTGPDDSSCSGGWSCMYEDESGIARSYQGAKDYGGRWISDNDDLMPPISPIDLDIMDKFVKPPTSIADVGALADFSTRNNMEILGGDIVGAAPIGNEIYNKIPSDDNDYRIGEHDRLGYSSIVYAMQLSPDTPGGVASSYHGGERIRDETIFKRSDGGLPTQENETGTRPKIHEYDTSNVCIKGYEMAGDSIYFRSGNREFDGSDKLIPGREQTYTSNYCCPKIANSGDCPRWNLPHPVKAGPATSNEPAPRDKDLGPNKNDYGGHQDKRIDANTGNCYIIDKPEFIAKKYYNEKYQDDYNSNPDFNRLVSGSIQCGPKDKSYAEEKYAGNQSHNDYETHSDYYTIDSIKLQDGSRAGTRFKLDSRYPFFSEYDSGATGYENYLDPYDFVPLKERTSDGQLSKYITNDTLNTDDLKISAEETTINDVIAKELGHDNRSNLYCENIACNDLEKTKYMQTVYDNFCVVSGAYDGSSPREVAYNKFYRPAWNDSRPTNIREDVNKKKLSDICCDPIDHSRKTSFVGCDANGKNPYFLDKIIRDYNNNLEPTLPNTSEEHNRNRMNPMPTSKHNLNQCIPSMEFKCNIDKDYLISSPRDSDILKIVRHQEICDSILDIKAINDYNIDPKNMNKDFTDRNVNDICKIESDGLCSAFMTPYIYNDLQNDSEIFKGKYWNRNRLTVGYVPHKGWYNKEISNSWNSGSDDSIGSDNLNQEYNMCVNLNPCSEIYDMEIYDKSIDSLSSPIEDRLNYPMPGSPTYDSLGFQNCYDLNYHSIRYIGNPQPTKDELLDKISIKCRNFEFGDNNTYSNIPFISEPKIVNSDEYIYNIGCISSPNNNTNEINMEIY